MSLPLVRTAPVRLWVGDTGPLMQEVTQSTRRGELTSALASLHHDSARLFVARHVLAEVGQDLPRYALDRGVDPTHALARWMHFYLPYITVVDVPASWGCEDERVAAVAARHSVDLPTAQLAIALAPCHAFIEDPDMADYGIGSCPGPGSKNSNWLSLAHGSANQAQLDLAGSAARIPSVLGLELAKAGARTVARLPDWAQATLVVLGGVTLYWWQRGGRAAQHLGRARTVLKQVGDVVLPIAETLLERYAAAQEAWENDVVDVGPVSLSEKIARCLALADESMTAAELAKEIGGPGSLRSRETAIRQELRTCEAFTETSRGRWRLGCPASDREPLVTPLQVTNWLRRAHGRQPLDVLDVPDLSFSPVRGTARLETPLLHGGRSPEH
jgi:hypothetical protein